MGTEIYIDNAEARHRQNPRSFKLPSKYDRTHLARGDFAKVIFACKPVPAGGPDAERMWLIVTGRRGGDFVGTLDNKPAFAPFTHHRQGEEFTFGPENVIDIIRAGSGKRMEDESATPRKKRGRKKTARKAPSGPRKARKSATKRRPAKRRKAAKKATPAPARRPAKRSRKAAPRKRTAAPKTARKSAPKAARKAAKKAPRKKTAKKRRASKRKA